VNNVGGASTPYEGAFTVNGTERGSVSGTLDPGTVATHTVTHRFTTAGTRELSFRTDSREFRAYEPAPASITDVSMASQDLDGPGTVTLDVVVSNEYDVPARRTVTVTRNREQVTRRVVSLGPGESRTVPVDVELPDTGEYEIGIDGAGTATVTVRETDTGSSTGFGPGFGTTGAIVALLVGAGLVALRRRP